MIITVLSISLGISLVIIASLWVQLKRYTARAARYRSGDILHDIETTATMMSGDRLSRLFTEFRSLEGGVTAASDALKRHVAQRLQGYPSWLTVDQVLETLYVFQTSGTESDQHKRKRLILLVLKEHTSSFKRAFQDMVQIIRTDEHRDEEARANSYRDLDARVVIARQYGISLEETSGVIRHLEGRS